jgi:hypothetical protein
VRYATTHTTNSLTAFSGYRFHFNGGEAINEVYGTDNYVDLGERGVDTRLGKLNWSIDPRAAEYPWQSPYAYYGNSPIWQLDYKGMGSTSTHTDKDGKVIAVYNDGDNNIYKHDDVSKWDGKSVLGKTGSGITKMGKTKYWDEFANHDSKNNIIQTAPNSGNYANLQAQIKFNVSVDNYTDRWHNYAKKEMDKLGPIDAILWLKEKSARYGILDVKENLGHATGYLLGDFYVTGESVGNYLFGLNVNYARPIIEPKGEFWTDVMIIAGAYHNKTNKVNNPRVPPYYGEINSSGRWISNGYWGGKKNLRSF